MGTTSFGERFWRITCEGLLPFFRFMFAVQLVVFLGLLLTLPFLERGSAAFTISVLAMVQILFLFGAIGFVYRRCDDRDPRV